MDRDALQDEVSEWVRDDIITDSQADEILSRYETDETRRSRVVLALSLVGTALVFLGITLFLATNWSELPRVARGIVLVSGPLFTYAAGIAAYARRYARIGLALCVLGALLVGPSVFLLDDLIVYRIPESWLLLTWTAIALPTGHALKSRVATGLGILVLGALVVELTEPADPLFVVGLLGIVLFALGHVRTERVQWTYRMGGAAFTLGALVLLTTLDGRFAQFEFELTAPLVTGVAGALAGIGWLHYTDESDGRLWAGISFLTLCSAASLAVLAPDTVPELLAFVGTHAALLASLVVTGYLGYRTHSQDFIDLAALGGLLQTLSFVAATVIDELSGAIALVVAGLILLTAGLFLERGRRSLLAEF